MELQQQADQVADAGRATDTTLGHLTLGELVIPLELQQDQQLLQALQQAFANAGIDMAEFIVGDPANKINPETGYPEFWKGWKKIRPIAKIAAPIALSLLAPGLGTAIGGSILGAGAVGASTLGSALLGAGIGAATGGGVKGALLGGALGGAGANIGNVGTAAKSGSGILGAAGRNIPGVYGLSNGLSSVGNSFGSLFGGGGDVASNGLRVGQAYNGTAAEAGFLNSARASSGIGSGGAASGGGGLFSNLLGGGGSSGGGSSFGNLASLVSGAGSLMRPAAAIGGGFQQNAALDKIKKQQLEEANNQLENIETLNPVDVQNDPGYQFNREQGEQALNRTLGAQGNLFSGRALQEASRFNQGLASDFYGQAYNRQNNKVGQQNVVYGNRGDIGANATMGRSNNINQTLANALGGSVGSFNGGFNGQMTNESLMMLMRQRGLA